MTVTAGVVRVASSSPRPPHLQKAVRAAFRGAKFHRPRSGAYDRVEVGGTTVGYVTENKTGAYVEVPNGAGGYEGFKVKSDKDVAAAVAAMASSAKAPPKKGGEGMARRCVDSTGSSATVTEAA